MIITRPVCKITIFSKFSIFVSIWIGIHNSPLCSLYFQENLLQSYHNRGEGAMSCSVNGGGESGLELVNKGLVGMCVTDGLCSGAGRWPSVWVFAVFNQCSAEQPVRQGPLVGNLNVDRERATTDSGLLDWHKKTITEILIYDPYNYSHNRHWVWNNWMLTWCKII